MSPGKFDQGLGVLSWTLMYAAWFGMICVAKTYLWCDEKVWLVIPAFLTGLLLNVALNLLLLPRLGLLGAVLGTCTAHLAALLIIYGCAAARGMRFDGGTLLLTALPLVLALGPWIAMLVLGVVLFLIVTTDRLFNADEKGQLLSILLEYLGKIRGLSQRAEVVSAAVD
jgi:O-antigen/teichoic acid export membrane protein